MGNDRLEIRLWALSKYDCLEKLERNELYNAGKDLKTWRWENVVACVGHAPQMLACLLCFRFCATKNRKTNS